MKSKMNDKEIEVLEKNAEKEGSPRKNLLNKIKRIYNIQEQISKPKGWIFKKCPECNRSIKKFVVHIDGSYLFLKYYLCKCGYEYAERY